MSSLSIFDAARDAPDATALVDGEATLSFRDAARRTAPLAAALLAARPQALALTPRADAESLFWLYAALATGTPVLTLHTRATAVERSEAIARARASTPPAVGARWEPSELPRVDDSAALAFLPTSGSTGRPRLVELSRRALTAAARSSQQNLGWQAGDRWLLCLPLAHTGGLSIVIRCLLARQSVALFEPGASGVLGQLDELLRVAQGATLMSLVPSLLSALLDAGWSPRPELRAVLVGGAGCSPALAQRAFAKRIPLLTSYGLTETSAQVVTRRYAERFQPLAERNGVVSSGQPLSGVSLRVEGGAIAIRSPALFSGYLGEAPPKLDSEGFWLTSDHGELGANGELYVRGRNDDVIISGGENIDPSEVEAAISALPGVKAVCVIGSPSLRFGQVVSALLVSDDPALGEPAHLAGLLAERLARHKWPRRVLLAESLPLTSSGKVDRRAASEHCRVHFRDTPER